MDAHVFDRLVAEAARRPTRRTAVRLLATGLIGALLPASVRAQRVDSDGDGLFDDDETDVYGTRPDVADTDGDNVGDGEEIYNRDNGLGGHDDPLVNEDAAALPAATCAGLGGQCQSLFDCCETDPNTPLNCCLSDANLGIKVCTYTPAPDYICPEDNVGREGPPAGSCSALGGACRGTPDCCPNHFGQPTMCCSGYCVDPRYDNTNCGACGNVCPDGTSCQPGVECA
jgi:hypothetical protein